MVLLSAVAIFAQSLDERTVVLTRARARVLETVQHLPRYTCVETVDRLIFKQENLHQTPGSCDSLIAMKRKGSLPVGLVATDRLSLDVAVGEGGREIYSWAGAKAFGSGRLDELVTTGPVGTGPFGPFLIDTFGQPGIDFSYRNGNEYWFRVPKALSHYRLLVGGTGHFFPYDGTVQIDRETADLRQMTARTGELPWESGVCEATTTITFRRVQIGQGEYLLPHESRLRFLQRTGDESENVISYASCHEFRGEASVRFDGPDSGATARTMPRRVRSVSAGLAMSLELETPIDTSTAAAGDAVTAKLRSTVSDKKLATLFQLER